MNIEEKKLDKLASDLSEIRKWFINNNTPDVRDYNGEPLWYKALYYKKEEIIDEILLSKVNLNIKNKYNTSWTIGCIQYGISPWLFQQGFSLINTKDWWKPNELGVHPFFIKNINPEIMFFICSRINIDAISWNNINYNNMTPEYFHKDNNNILKIILRAKKII